MTRTNVLKLVKAGKEMILADSLYDTPYNEKQTNLAYTLGKMNVSWQLIMFIPSALPEGLLLFI